jgi:hypothetical protein
LVVVSSLQLQTGERAIGMLQENVFMLFTKQLDSIFGAVEKQAAHDAGVSPLILIPPSGIVSWVA